MPTEKDVEQSRFFANRVAKRDKHLAKWARRLNTDCYRVYDRDIPEVPVSLDRYGDAAVLCLYERPYDKPEAEEAVWLELMATTASEALRLDRGQVFIKTRKHLGIEEQYGRSGTYALADRTTHERAVHEQGLSFLVNLEDYIDTGLFMDHRPAREMVKGLAPGRRTLNLFCYTGSFSVYALAGGASEVLGVDLSNTYLSWAERNIALNGFNDGRYRGVRSDAGEFLTREAAKGSLWDLIILDPPTFSNSKKVEGFFDVVRHWPALVASCIAVLAPEGVIVFSTNARSLRMDSGLVTGAKVEDISERSIPEDFRGHPHRTWLIRRE